MQVLYIFVGYPGSGKTTVANAICESTGAEHIWADRERQKMFGDPTHSADESNQLYNYLNDTTRSLLEGGTSVVFDTNFNYRKDRDYLRHIATETNSKMVIIQMTTPVNVARERALHGSHAERNGMSEPMELATFQRIVDHLEPLSSDEPHIEIDGTDLTQSSVNNVLDL